MNLGGSCSRWRVQRAEPVRLLHLIVVSLPNCKTIGFLLKTASVAAAGLTIVSGDFNMDSKSVVVRLTQVPRPTHHLHYRWSSNAS